MKRLIFLSMATMLMMMAYATSVFACGWISYQPNVPKSLQR